MSLPLFLRQAVLGLIITWITKSKDKVRCWDTEAVASCLFFSLPFSPHLTFLTSLLLSPSFLSPFHSSHPFPLSPFSFLLFPSLSLCLSLSVSLWIYSESIFKFDNSGIWVLMGFIFQRTFQREVLISGEAYSFFDTFFFKNKLIGTLRGYHLSNCSLPPQRLDRLSTTFSTTILTSPSLFPCFRKWDLFLSQWR